MPISGAMINVIEGVNTSDATMAAGDLLETETGYGSAGTKITGTMPNKAGDNNAVSSHTSGTSIHVVPPEGYYDGSDDAVVITDADFVAAKILKDADVFGVTGTLEDCLAAYANAMQNDTDWTTYPTGITKLGPGAYYYHSHFKGTSIPAAITAIGRDAFPGSGLALSATQNWPLVATIGSAAFSWVRGSCTNLTIGSAGHPVTSIAADSFSGWAANAAMTIYTADGNALANSPFGATGTTPTWVQA